MSADTTVLPLVFLAGPPLVTAAATLTSRLRACCPVRFPGADARAVPCTQRMHHTGRHLNKPTGRTWPNISESAR